MSYTAEKKTCRSCGATAFEDPYRPYRDGACPTCWVATARRREMSKAERRAAVAAHNAAYEARAASGAPEPRTTDVSPKARSDYARWLTRTGMTPEAAARVAASAAPDRIRTVLGAIAPLVAAKSKGPQ